MGTSYRTVILGGGPAGLAVLVAASRDGTLDELLSGGIAIVERGPAIGSGNIGNYAITSDSTAETFLTAVTGHVDPRLGKLLDHPLCKELQGYGRSAVPLVKAGALMSLIGTVLHDAIVDAGGAVFTSHEAVQAQQSEDGGWQTTVRSLVDGSEFNIASQTLLMAMGGHQKPERLASDAVGGIPLLPSYASKVISSDVLLRREGVERLGQKLAGHPEPRIAIVGGSTSALASACLLLNELPEETSKPASITILHRRTLRVFYPSAEAALADGYTEFDDNDICSLSGFVFRLAGFRLDSRDLVMRVRQIGGRGPEPRVRLHQLSEANHGETHEILTRADAIVAAMGYRPRLLPILDADGREITLAAEDSDEKLIDRSCRVLDISNSPVPNLFGIGLAAGFVPYGPLGGEPSFKGQANGLWLWQTAVGSMICNSLLQAGLDTRDHPHTERTAQYSA